MRGRAILTRKLIRDLGRRRAQVAAVAITVIIGIVVFVLTANMASSLSDSYDLTYERTQFGDVWVTGGSPELASDLASVVGIERIENRISADVGVQFDDRPVSARVVGYGQDTTLNSLVITDGVGLDEASVRETGGAVVEQHTADHFDLKPGDSVIVANVGEVTIVGVAVSPEWLWVAPNQQDFVVDPDEFGVLFVSDTMAEQAAPQGSQLVISVVDGNSEIVDVVVAMAIKAGAGEVLTQETHPSNQALKADLDGFSQISIMVPALFLLAAGLATTVLSGRLIIQQRAEIGMLRANGFATSTIERHFASYGVVVALIGAIPAIPAGAIAGRFATEAYTNFLGVPFASTQLNFSIWLVALVFAIVVGSIAGAMPARAAIKIDPAQAMRPGGGTVDGRHSLLERALPKGSPSWARVALRNMARQPRRAATTAMGVLLAMVLTMTGFVLNDTISNLFDTQFNETDLRGLVVSLDAPVDDNVLETLGAVPGVEVVEPHVEIPASIVTDSGVATQRLQVFAAGTELHGFAKIGGLPSEGLVLSAGAASKLDVAAGDQVEVGATDGTIGTIEVIAVIIEPFTGSSFLSAAAWSEIGGTAPDTVAIGLTDSDNHAEVRDAVSEIPGVEQISDRIATAEQVEELLAASRFFVGVILALAILMAVALIFNALSVTIGERETEVATLQANGVGRSWIRRAITAENLATVAVGLIPGLILGRLSAGLFVKQFSTDQFRMDPIVHPTSLALAVVVIAACALVAQIPGLRRLDRLNLASKVRERAL